MSKKKTASKLSELREKYGAPEVQYLSTGNPVLDDLWNGGLPTGKLIELHSESGLGKTTVSVQIAKSLLKKGYKVGYLDVESALDLSLKKSLGVDEYENVGIDGNPVTESNPVAFLHLQPITFSEVEDIVDYMIDNDYRLIIYDSLTMTLSDRRREGSIIDEQPGLKSRYQAQFIEQYKGEISRKSITLLIINQMRTNISFINSRLEPAGGQGLKFGADIRTGLRRVDWLFDEHDKNKKIGVKLEAVTIKNKLALPFRAASFYLYFGKGIDVLQTVSEILIERGIVEQKGSYFKLPDGNNVQGKKNVFAWVKDNSKEAKKLLGDFTTFFKGEPSE